MFYFGEKQRSASRLSPEKQVYVCMFFRNVPSKNTGNIAMSTSDSVRNRRPRWHTLKSLDLHRTLASLGGNRTHDHKIKSIALYHLS